MQAEARASRLSSVASGTRSTGESPGTVSRGNVGSVHDAIVVGSGPNGLAAAIVLARAGRSVSVLEGRDTIGGGLRTEELTLPGFRHDTCAAIHPLGIASPFMRSIPLGEHGVEWIQPPAPLAHPLDDGTAVLLERSLSDTGAGLGEDARAWRRLFEPLVDASDELLAEPSRARPRGTRFTWRASG